MSSQPQTAIVGVTRAVPGRVGVPGADVRVLGEGHPARSDLLDFVAGTNIVVSMFSDRVDAEFLDAAGPGLAGVCNFAVGVNNIDLDACRERGVRVTNTPDAVTEGTANMAWALLLAVSRRVVEGDRYARSGGWASNGPLGMGDFLGMDLVGKTMHIVGAGRIGYATAVRARAFGMNVVYTARSRHIEFEIAPLAASRVDLEDGLRIADVVSIHTPLTPETTHLLNEERIGLMKREAIVINTSRGPTIDEGALAAALESGRIRGAGLDVFEHEPEIHPGLRPLDNVVMMPHIGSAEIRWRQAMTQMVSENAGAILDGREPPNRVA